jgi:myo-inositol-1(or 4)-monophosphatase
MKLADDLARETGDLQRSRLAGARQIKTKTSATDLVSDVDCEAERWIVSRLSEARPDDSILGEEGTLREGTSAVRWVIDPLDGTTNYVYGYPAFAVSIAAEIDGVPQIGVVYDTVAGRCYRAVSGCGAFCEDRPIKVTQQADLARALVGTGFSYDAAQRRMQGSALALILGRVSDIRRSGSAALDLCHVASGQLDAYWELDNAPWDYAAASVIAREAGAVVELAPACHGRGPAVVAANSSLMSAFLALLREAGVLA